MINVLVLAGNKRQFKTYEKALKKKHEDATIQCAYNEKYADGLWIDKIELVGQYWLNRIYNSKCYRSYKAMIGEENISKEFAEDKKCQTCPPRVAKLIL